MHRLRCLVAGISFLSSGKRVMLKNWNELNEFERLAILQAMVNAYKRGAK